ncbi:ATP-binding cassette domain-containing protein [Rhodocyclus tenuis]|uniref:ATP-binding cassette domain-containing protein n=1 Tax=Rhodocyclus gracilis TaxID=2929842 RepID=A0ABX0WJB0_9RHOO|nr:ATP-binding cassette domain-containing protein [Rhodocyclus gracilis]
MIEIDNISKHYVVDGVAIPAISGISLRVEAGEVFGIIGVSGAGKSTLVRTLNLLERPDSGRIRVDGSDITTLSKDQLLRYRRKTGMIFQHFNLISAKTVGENIRFPLKLAGEYTRAEMDRRVDELLDLVELGGHRDKYPAQLSGGQKQRVGIARALANHPKLLLCDEATSALDPQTTQSILSLLLDINRRFGLTIVLITHEMDVIRRICDRVAVLDRGVLVEEGVVADVLLHPQHEITRALVQESCPSATTGQRLGLSGPLFRLTFLGAVTYQPILQRISAALDVGFNIVEGVVGRIKETPYGQITVQALGDAADPARIAAAFGEHAVRCEALPS